MRKKGMLLASEVLKVVLAVISISFLIYLLFALYYANANEQAKAQATEVVNRMKDIVTRLNSGVITSERITDINPEGWNIFSYTGSERKPNLCAGENCLCICDEVFYDNINVFGIQLAKDRQLNECDKKGVCLAIPALSKFQDFEIKSASDGGTNILIGKNGGAIVISEA